MGITDEWLAWQLDETCLIVGREVEKEMHENPKKNPFQDQARRTTQFASMKYPGIKKMKIPENGIW